MRVCLLSALAALLVASLVPGAAFATTSWGPEYGTGTDGGGSYAWTNPGNIAADDALVATRSVTSAYTSNTLWAKGLGFNIPSDATILGVSVAVSRYASSSFTPFIRDSVVQLTKDGTTFVGTNKAATGANWPSTEAEATYGGAADLWGDTWTPAQINSANFGVGLKVTCSGATARTASVNYVNVTVSYSAPHVSNASAGANDPSAGDTAWTGTGNIGADDSAYATVALTQNTTSQYLNATGFGLNIPLDATVNGIVVEVDRVSSGTSSPLIRDHTVQLLKGGARVGSNKAATGTDWPTAEAVASYGGAADMWGTTWTPAEVNASDFGVSLRVSDTNATRARTASVDYVRITVDYDLNPRCTITAAPGQSNPTNSKAIQFSVHFSRPVTGLDASDFVVGGTAGGFAADSLTGSDSDYTLTVLGGLGSTDGILNVLLPASSCNAITGGQANRPAVSPDISVDTVRPTVGIEQLSTADPTNAQPLAFRVTLSEAVTSLPGSYFTIGGTATGFAVSNVVPQGDNVFDVFLEGAPTTDGTVSLSLQADTVADAAGNGNTASTSVDNEITYDETAPISQLQASFGPNGLDGWYTQQPVLTLGANEPGQLWYKWDDAADWTSYTLSPTIVIPEGTHTLYYLATDLATNLEASQQHEFKMDSTPPTVTVNQHASQVDPANGTVYFTVQFSEAVSGLGLGDFTIGGTAGGFGITSIDDLGSGAYTVALGGAQLTDGTVTLAVDAGGAYDVAGNLNEASTSADNEITFDGTRPSVTVAQAASQSDPTNVSSVDFDVTFSEDVNGLNSSDFGSAGTSSAFDHIEVNGSGKDYVVTLSGTSPSDGTVVLTLSDDAAFDDAGNGNASPVYADNVATYDTTPPMTAWVADIDPNTYDWFNALPNITLSTVSDPDATIYYHWDADADAEYDGEFAAPGDGIHTLHFHAVDLAGNIETEDDVDFYIDTTAPSGTVTINAGAGVTTSRGVDLDFTKSDASSDVAEMRLSTDGTTWNDWQSYQSALSGFMLPDADGVRTVYVQFKDYADNVSGSYSDTIVLDTHAPNVTVEQGVADDPTNATSIEFDVTFDEPVTGLETADFSLTGTATGFSITGLSGSGADYVVTVSGTTVDDGTLILDLPAARVIDTNGNTNTASTSTDNQVTYDGTPPTCAIARKATQDAVTAGKTIVFHAEFNEYIYGITADDFVVGGTATGFEVTGLSGGNDPDITVSGASVTDGTVTLSLAAGKGTDLAGNGNLASTAGDDGVTFDGSAATPTGLKVTGYSNSTVGLAWDAVTDAHGPVSYKVWTDGVAPVTIPGTSKTFTGLSAGTSYTFHVQSVDGLGNASPEASVTQATAASAVSAVVAGTGPQSVTLATSQGDATVSFSNVTAPGTLFLTPVPTAPAEATGSTLVQIGDLSYEVTFTGTFSGTVTIVLPYNALLPDARALTALVRHYGASGWETITPTVDTSAATFTFTLTSLSPLVVAEPKGADWALKLTTNFAGKTAATTVFNPAYGKAATLQVKVAAANGTAVGKKTVVLQRLSGGTWVDVARATEGTKGMYAVAVKTSAKTAYRFAVAPDAFTSSATGAAYTVYPKVKTSITKAPKSAKKSRSFTLKGSVSPKHAKGTKVYLQFSQYSKSKKRYVYKYAKTVKLANATSSSTFSYKAKIKSKGKWEVRVYVKSDSLHYKTYSAYQKITVK